MGTLLLEMQVSLYYKRIHGEFKRSAEKIQAKKKFFYYPAARTLFQHITQERETKKDKKIKGGKSPRQSQSHSVLSCPMRIDKVVNTLPTHGLLLYSSSP